MDSRVSHTIGQLVDASRPVLPQCLDRLSVLLDDNGERDALAAVCRDPRVPADAWAMIWLREIAQLLQWCAYRAMAALADPDPSALQRTPVRSGMVLSLLPRHGVAVHLLRRALPFAALGMPVIAGFPKNLHAQGSAVAARLAAALGVADLVRVPDTPGHVLVKELDREPEATVVVTGRPQTVATVRSATRHHVVGCAGRCAVVVADDAATLAEVRAWLAAYNKPRSCTRLVAAFLGQVHSPSWRGWHESTGGRDYNRDEALQRLHPSIIYHYDYEHGDGGDSTGEIAGFTVIPCDARGGVETLIGFARDPVYGWPGDFLL